MKKFIAGILFGIGKVIALIPLPVMYVFSDIFICPLLHYVIRYRLKVVRSNLKRCFPNKSQKQLRAMENCFYRQFCDNIQEMVHMIGMSRREATERAKFEGYAVISEYLKSGRNVLLYASHYTNWEFQTFFNILYPDQLVYSVYHPLSNAVIDELMKKVRSRYGAVPVSKKVMTRTFYEAGHTSRCAVFGMVADQYAAHDRNCCLLTLLGQDNTHFINGVERLARRTNAVVIYSDVERVSRGHYKSTLRIVTEDAVSLPEGEVTARYAKMLEETILRAPQYWLWSHRRWREND